MASEIAVERYVFIDPSKKDKIALQLREMGVEMDYSFGDNGSFPWGKSILIHLRALEEIMDSFVPKIDGVRGVTDRLIYY